MSEQIKELTPEQEAKLPIYRDMFEAIGLSTEPTNKSRAEELMIKAYQFLHNDPEYTENISPNPEIIWADSPYKGAKLAAQHANGREDVTKQEIQDQASNASYGSFDAYWVSTYSFINNELVPQEKKCELVDIITEITKESGVYWTFEDLVIMTPKPKVLKLKDKKLHSLDSKALEYANGDGFYAYEGERKGSLMEVVMSHKNLKTEQDEEAGSVPF